MKRTLEKLAFLISLMVALYFTIAWVQSAIPAKLDNEIEEQIEPVNATTAPEILIPPEIPEECIEPEPKIEEWPELPTPEVDAYLFSVEHQFVITAYCPCEKCCGEWAKLNEGKTPKGAAGTELVSGVSVAVDNRIFKFGTVFLDEEGNEYIAADTGGAIKGYHIDLFFNTHEEALKWGRQTKWLSWLEEG